MKPDQNQKLTPPRAVAAQLMVIAQVTVPTIGATIMPCKQVEPVVAVGER